MRGLDGGQACGVAASALLTCRPLTPWHGFAWCRIKDLFSVCVCMEDGPPKPDPFPVARACQLLGVAPKDTIMVRSGRV